MGSEMEREHGAGESGVFVRNITETGSELFQLTEMAGKDLHTATGETNPETGLPMTVLDVIKREEAQKHEGRVLLHIGEYSSAAARAANKALHRKRTYAAAGAFIVTVLAIRQAKKRSH